MIDHIFIAVRDLAKGERFYAAALATLGFAKLKDWEGAAIGFGKKYPEFWINKREAMGRVPEDSGVHICLRAPDTASVDAFHAVYRPTDAGRGGFRSTVLRPGARRLWRRLSVRRRRSAIRKPR